MPKEVERAEGPRESGGFWSLIANSIFTLSIIAVVVIFVGQWYLNRNIASLGASLSAAKEELQPERIQELNRAYDRINAVKTLLLNHVTVSNLFDELNQMTVKNLRLNELTFNMLSGKGISLTFKGEAIGYVTVAEQADVFGKQNFFKSPIFYDLNLNDQGAVVFAFKSDIDPSAIILNNQPAVSPTQ